MEKVKISKSLVLQLPPDERDGLADFLWSKSGGICYLCERAINLATDDIDVDHEVAVSEGGLTNRSNLHFTHRSCNRAKSNYPKGDIRPLLRLRSFAHDHGNVINYEDAQLHFGFAPKESVMIWDRESDFAEFHLPNGKIVNSPVFKETDGRGIPYYYTFLEVPREAIFNDSDCQPRSIKVDQAWAIYSDIENNPIHEPPSCRLIHTSGSHVKLAMFDGQHKSVALWMHGRLTTIAKIYLNLDRDQTIRLVGSIQSRIKKLPLSSFESAMKMGEEWEAYAAAYESSVGTDNASEVGLINSIPPQDRKRAKDAFAAQLLKEVLELDDLRILQLVQREGQPKLPHLLISETSFKKKLVANLRNMTPIPEKGEDRERARARELDNITLALNSLADMAFLNQDGGVELEGAAQTRRDRMKYQASLAYLAILIRRLFRQVLSVDTESRSLLERDLNDQQKVAIREGIRRICEHPIWTCSWDQSAATQSVYQALTKNQDAAEAFRNVELRGEYVNGHEALPANWDKSK